MKYILILFINLCVLSVGYSNSEVVDANHYTLSAKQSADLTYSWAANFQAIAYSIEIENQATGNKQSLSTTNNTATFYGLPNGTYDVTVIAEYQSGSSSIVIEDITEL